MKRPMSTLRELPSPGPTLAAHDEARRDDGPVGKQSIQIKEGPSPKIKTEILRHDDDRNTTAFRHPPMAPHPPLTTDLAICDFTFPTPQEGAGPRVPPHHSGPSQTLRANTATPRSHAKDASNIVSDQATRDVLEKVALAIQWSVPPTTAAPGSTSIDDSLQASQNIHRSADELETRDDRNKAGTSVPHQVAVHARQTPTASTAPQNFLGASDDQHEAPRVRSPSPSDAKSGPQIDQASHAPPTLMPAASVPSIKRSAPNLDKPMPNLPPPSSRLSEHMRSLRMETRKIGLDAPPLPTLDQGYGGRQAPSGIDAQRRTDPPQNGLPSCAPAVRSASSTPNTRVQSAAEEPYSTPVSRVNDRSATSDSSARRTASQRDTSVTAPQSEPTPPNPKALAASAPHFRSQSPVQRSVSPNLPSGPHRSRTTEPPINRAPPKGVSVAAPPHVAYPPFMPGTRSRTRDQQYAPTPYGSRTQSPSGVSPLAREKPRLPDGLASRPQSPARAPMPPPTVKSEPRDEDRPANTPAGPMAKGGIQPRALPKSNTVSHKPLPAARGSSPSKRDQVTGPVTDATEMASSLHAKTSHPRKGSADVMGPALTDVVGLPPATTLLQPPPSSLTVSLKSSIFRGSSPDRQPSLARSKSPVPSSQNPNVTKKELPTVPLSDSHRSATPENMMSRAADAKLNLGDPLQALHDLTKQSDAIHARYASLRSDRLKASKAISVNLKDARSAQEAGTSLWEQHLTLNSLTSSMDICVARLISLDCKKEEALTAFIEQTRSGRDVHAVHSRVDSVADGLASATPRPAVSTTLVVDSGKPPAVNGTNLARAGDEEPLAPRTGSVAQAACAAARTDGSRTEQEASSGLPRPLVAPAAAPTIESPTLSARCSMVPAPLRPSTRPVSPRARSPHLRLPQSHIPVPGASSRDLAAAVSSLECRRASSQSPLPISPLDDTDSPATAYRFPAVAPRLVSAVAPTPTPVLLPTSRGGDDTSSAAPTSATVDDAPAGAPPSHLSASSLTAESSACSLHTSASSLDAEHPIPPPEVEARRMRAPAAAQKEDPATATLVHILDDDEILEYYKLLG